MGLGRYVVTRSLFYTEVAFQTDDKLFFGQESRPLSRRGAGGGGSPLRVSDFLEHIIFIIAINFLTARPIKQYFLHTVLIMNSVAMLING